MALWNTPSSDQLIPGLTYSHRSDDQNNLWLIALSLGQFLHLYFVASLYMHAIYFLVNTCTITNYVHCHLNIYKLFIPHFPTNVPRQFCYKVIRNILNYSPSERFLSPTGAAVNFLPLNYVYSIYKRSSSSDRSWPSKIPPQIFTKKIRRRISRGFSSLVHFWKTFYSLEDILFLFPGLNYSKWRSIYFKFGRASFLIHLWQAVGKSIFQSTVFFCEFRRQIFISYEDFFLS